MPTCATPRDLSATVQADEPSQLWLKIGVRGCAKLGHDDPLGDIPAEELKKKKLDKVLLEGEPEAAALVHSATEEFAQELFGVIRRFLRLKEWRETQTILIGGGFAPVAWVNSPLAAPGFF